jgi:Mrp family chromosome partitioning ATPase/capsular polysaccharide biosynthesis protein
MGESSFSHASPGPVNEELSPTRRYLRLLRRQALLILVVPAVAIATTAFVTLSRDSVYRATMTLVVVQSGGQASPEFGSEQLSQTMARLLESDAVAEDVIRNLRLDATPSDLKKDLKVSFRPSSSVLDVSFDSTNRPMARRILEEFSTVFETQVDQKLGVRSERGALGRQSLLPIISVSVFDHPHLLPERVAPRPARTLGFAAALGLALGLLLALVRDSLDDRIHDREEAEESFGAPLIGGLPRGARGKPPPVVGPRRTGSSKPLMHALRLLRANLEFSQTGIRGPTILVTSGVTAEGKTTVAAYLGAALALGGSQVICVEADLRRPQIHRYLGIPPGSPGLVDVLAGEANLDDVLQPVDLLQPHPDGDRPELEQGMYGGNNSAGHSGPAGLRLLSMGSPMLDPARVLTSEAVSELVDDLRLRADYVIFDSPPLLALPDSFPLALHSDNVLVVARRGRTTKAKAEAVRGVLRDLGVKSFAVVLTDEPRSQSYGYGYY